MYDIDRAIRRLELAQRIDELQRQKAATAEQGLSVDAIAAPETADAAAAIPSPAAPASVPLAAEAATAAPNQPLGTAPRAAPAATSATAPAAPRDPAPVRASVGPQPAPRHEPSGSPPAVAPPAAADAAAVPPSVVPTRATTTAAAAPAVVVSQVSAHVAPASPQVAQVAPIGSAPDAGLPGPLPDTGSPAVVPAASPLASGSPLAPEAAPDRHGVAAEQNRAVAETDGAAAEALIGAALLAERLPQESVTGLRWAQALEDHLTRGSGPDTGPFASVAEVGGAIDQPSIDRSIATGQDASEDLPTLLPRAVAPMPLANWATPPGGPDSEPAGSIAPLSRGASERPRPASADLLPRAVVPLTSASRAQSARHALDAQSPDPRPEQVADVGVPHEMPTGSAAEPIELPAEHLAEQPAEHPLVQPTQDTFDDSARYAAARSEESPVASSDDPAVLVDEPTALADEAEQPGGSSDPITDGSGLTAASIIADLLRHGDRSLLS
jgi:hypothetical protein